MGKIQQVTIICWIFLSYKSYEKPSDSLSFFLYIGKYLETPIILLISQMNEEIEEKINISFYLIYKITHLIFSMLPVYKASAFQKFALEGGSSLPCIVSVEDEYGHLLNDDFVIKVFKQDKSNHTCK